MARTKREIFRQLRKIGRLDKQVAKAVRNAVEGWREMLDRNEQESLQYWSGVSEQTRKRVNAYCGPGPSPTIIVVDRSRWTDEQLLEFREKRAQRALIAH